MAAIEERVARLEGITAQVNERLGTLHAELRALREDMNALRKDMDAGFQAQRQYTDAKFQSLRGDYGALRKDIDTKFEALRAEMHSNTRWVVGLIIVQGVTILAALIGTLLAR